MEYIAIGAGVAFGTIVLYLHVQIYLLGQRLSEQIDKLEKRVWNLEN